MATYTITVVKLPVPEAGLVKIGSSFESGIIQEEGTTVNALATPASGYSFVNWMIDDVIVSTSRPYSFTMPANNIVLTATFIVVEIPPEEEQVSIYDTSCPKFYFVANMTDRYFTGDIIDLSSYDYFELDDEPVNFDSGKFKLERDSTYHGFNYEFSVDELSYEIGELGYDYLKNKIYSEGTDSDVKFVYGFGTTTSLSIFYLGKIDFNEYKEINNGDLVSFSLREIDFDNLLQTAFEVDQSSMATIDVLLYSKVIPKKVSYRVPRKDITEDGGIESTYPTAHFSFNTWAIGATQYMFINDGKEGDTELEIFTTYDFQVEQISPYTESSQYKYLFKVKQSGDYTLIVKVLFRVEFFWAGIFVEDPTESMKMKIGITKPDGTTLIGAIANYNPTVLNPDTYYEDEYTDLLFDYTINFGEDLKKLELEECVYFYFIPQGAGIQVVDKITILPFPEDSDLPEVLIKVQTTAPSKVAKFISPLPLLESVISQSAQTSYTTVISDFLSDDGCGGKLALTNGFNIRGVDQSVRTYIKTNAKNLVDSLSNLFCLGWGVEYDVLKNELIRIEPVEYFYQDVEIIELDNISDYTKEIDSTKYYNEIEVGFTKYSKQRETDKGNTLDDFHTKHLYQTPIKTNKNKLSKVTDLTLSGYEIEILRRKQFEKDGDNDNGNFKEDEDLFGVQLLDYTLFEGANYLGYLSDMTGGDILYVDESYMIVRDWAYFYTGQPITVNVDNQGAKTNTIYSVQYGYFTPNGYTEAIVGTLIKFGSSIDPVINAPTSWSVIILLLGGESYYIPESSQPFDSISNLLSPETGYNIRYSPKRMLYTHAKLFNGGFFGKVGTDLINFKSGDGNVELETNFNITEPCVLGDVDNELIIENSNVMISDIYNRGFLFLPFKVSFSAAFSFEQLTLLKSCLRGQDSGETPRNYGYITITNPCGAVEQIYVMSAEYSGIEDEVKIEGYLKNIV